MGNKEIDFYNYCTLFDSMYLSRGIAMYESLRNHTRNFHLFIFAFDDRSFQILKEMDLMNVTIISLSEFETPELLAIKSSRTKGEYCWTCTPSIISYLLCKYDLPDCTYLDADLIFYDDPAVLISEMIENRKNVLITEHRFSFLAKIYEEKRAGRFCVQFVTFFNNKESLDILEKWRLQCIEWCYARHEDGKFGDQKYLDEWPDEYKNIHILKHEGGGIAPWNIQKYVFKKAGNSIIGKIRSTGSEFKVIFYHFQYVKFMKNNSFDVGWQPLSLQVKKIFYIPYIKKLVEIEDKLNNTYLNYRTIYTEFNTQNLKNIVKTFFKKTFSYNIINQISNGISN